MFRIINYNKLFSFSLNDSLLEAEKMRGSFNGGALISFSLAVVVRALRMILIHMSDISSHLSSRPQSMLVVQQDLVPKRLESFRRRANCDWRHSNVNTEIIIVVIMWKCRILLTRKEKRKNCRHPEKMMFAFLFDLAECFARFFFVSVCFLIFVDKLELFFPPPPLTLHSIERYFILCFPCLMSK